MNKKYVFELVVRESENLEKICSMITACDYTFEELRERKVDNEILFCKDILVDHLPKKELEKYFKEDESHIPFIGAPQKVILNDDKEVIKNMTEEDWESWHHDDSKMTEEDWNSFGEYHLKQDTNEWKHWKEKRAKADEELQKLVKEDPMWAKPLSIADPKQ